MKSVVEFYQEELMFHGFIPCCMGTRLDLLMIGRGEQSSRRIWSEITGKLVKVERIVNRFDPCSEVGRLNHLQPVAPVTISHELERILLLCRYYYQQTKGLFDVTLHDFSEIRLENRQLSFLVPGIQLDLGGFAKGYALQIIQQMLKKEGINQAFVNFGNSSILGMGKHPCGDAWKVGLPNPYDGRILQEFNLCDQTLSTSGNTSGYTGHIRNPRTGEYNRKRMLCTVVANDPLDAEVLSTVGMITYQEERRVDFPHFNNIQIERFFL